MHRILSKNRLRIILGVFFIALAIPTAILISQAFQQMKWETFRQFQQQAEKLANRIDKQFSQLIQEEEARSFAEYSFLNVVGDVQTNFLQRSPLAQFPLTSDIPGVIGYFQVDDQGKFSTPLLPVATSLQPYCIPDDELTQRFTKQNEVQQILFRNQLVVERKTLPAEPRILESTIELNKDLSTFNAGASQGSNIPKEETSALLQDSATSQLAFDRLQKREGESLSIGEQRQRAGSLGRVDELQLKKQDVLPERKIEKIIAKEKTVSSVMPQKIRREQSLLPEPIMPQAASPSISATNIEESIRITTFESKIDPFSFSQLDSGHFVLFRKVWRDGQRYTQGILLDQKKLLHGIIESAFKETSLYQMSNLLVSYRDNIFSVLNSNKQRNLYSSTTELQGELLLQTRLSSPLSEMQLIFSITHLPNGAGANIIVWTSVMITLVLISGFYLIYRLGVKQIALIQQQQDFVSAVSHELKTPLTSIRMYGEILREGWANEEKKKEYYDFIYDESERLSRLIQNVLHLARINSNNNLKLNIKPVAVRELLDNIRSKISTQLQHNGFELQLKTDDAAAETTLQVDPDAFLQIIINLVDNGIKFSRKAEMKRIDINCKLLKDNSVQFSVRDYGPGVTKNQMKKIFKLFYRSENELTRETVGTGIGLALVKQLTTQMDAKVDVVNREPGAEFRVVF